MINSDNKKMKELENSYNEVPYMSKSFYKTQPIKLKINLKLLDFDSPELENAKVLEIGCSFGGNIIPFALSYPKSKVIGIDLSEVQINEGNKLIKHLGIDNIKLIHQNILEYETDEKFDYIICHGVYSWVPNNVQDRILEVIKKNLSKNGVAIISYNTYPGWKSLEIIRDAMLFRDQYLTKRGVEINKDNKVGYGRGAVEFLKDYSFLNGRVKTAIDHIVTKDDFYILHEYFEVFNKPTYLYSFNEKLNEYGLQHITDTDLSISFPMFSDDIENKINTECEEDYIAREQYYDYLLDRQFRSSIITHEANVKNIDMSKQLSLYNLREFHFRLEFLEEEESLNENVIFSARSQILEFIISKYPETVTIEEIETYLKDKVLSDDIYMTIFNLVYHKKIEVFEKKLTFKKQERLKLLPRYKKYIEYFASVDNPIISFASRSGLGYQLENFQFVAQNILRYFDGTNTDQEIIEDLLKREKAGEVSISSTDNSAEKTVENFVGKLRTIVESSFFSEEI